MSHVNARMILSYYEAMKSYPHETPVNIDFWKGSQWSEDHLPKPNDFLEWDECVTILKNLQSANLEVERLAKLALNSDAQSVWHRVFGNLASMKSIYKFCINWIGPRANKNQTGTFKDLGNNKIEIRTAMKDGYQGCLYWSQLTYEAFLVFPEIFGYARPKVYECQVTDRTMQLVLQVPQRRSWTSVFSQQQDPQVDRDETISLAEEINELNVSAQMLEAGFDTFFRSIPDGLIFIVNNRVFESNPQARKLVDLPAIEDLDQVFRDVDRQAIDNLLNGLSEGEVVLLKRV